MSQMKTELQQLEEEHVQDLDSIFANSPSLVKRRSASREQLQEPAGKVSDHRPPKDEEIRSSVIMDTKKSEGWIDTTFKAENTSNLVHEVSEDRRRAGLHPETAKW